MRTITAAEAKRVFREVIQDAQKEDVVITRYGKPVVIVRGIAGISLADVLHATASRAQPEPIRQLRGKRRK